MSLTAYIAPFMLSGLSDVSVAPGAGQSGYPLVWDNSLGKWVASNVIAGVSVRAGIGANSQSLGSICNSSGSSWIAQGPNAAQSSTTGYEFIAQGLNAGKASTTGYGWIAQGPNSGQASTTGFAWIAQGLNAGFSNISGNFWIAQGGFAGYLNTSGSSWIAQGPNAARSNTTGSFFIAQGGNAGRNNISGSSWIAQGYEAGYFEERGNTYHLGVSRSKSLLVGEFATNCLYIGHAGPITSAATCPTPTAAAHLAASTTARASLRIDTGVAPTTPNNGDIWFDGTDLKIRINNVTRTIQVV